MINFFEKIYKYEEWLLSIAISSFLLRPILPQYIKFILFPVILFLLFILCIKFFKAKIFHYNKFKIELKVFYPVFVLFCFYLLALVFSRNYGVILFKDVSNNIIVLVTFIVIYFNIKQLSSFQSLLFKVRHIFIYTAGLFASLGLLKLFLQFYGMRFSWLYVPRLGYPLGTSLSIDSNFYALSCIICFIFIVSEIYKLKTKWQVLFFQIILYVLILSIFLSSSRRAILFGIFLVLGVILFWGYSFFSKNIKLVQYRRNISFLVLLVLLTSVFFHIFFVEINSARRDRFLSFLSVNKADVVDSFAKSFNFIARYVNQFSSKDEIWSTRYNPNSPLSGWARANYKIVRDISGRNSGIVPQGAYGAKISKGIDSYYDNNISMYYSVLSENEVTKDKHYISSVKCFVSDNFNGDDVFLSYEKNGRHLQHYHYDLSRKGIWQELKYSVAYQNEKVTSSLYVEKEGVVNFNNLEGYVIFAYPTFKEVKFDPTNPATWMTNVFKEGSPLCGNNVKIIPNTKSIGAIIDSSGITSCWDGKAVYYTQLFENQNNDRNKISIYCNVSPDFDGDEIFLAAAGEHGYSLVKKYDMSQKGIWQKLVIDFVSSSSLNKVYLYVSKNNASNFKRLKGHVIIAYPEISIEKVYSNILNGKRKITYNSFFPFCSYFFKKDSLGEKISFQKIMGEDNFIGPRYDRWRYAIYIYQYEYNTRQQFIGDGFNYTKKFARTFEIKNGYDYPHNPFLSILLYSGIIGFLVYIWFLYYIVYYYWIYRKDYWLYGLCFLASFFFAFFSANSPFDPAIVGIFSILPYFIHYYEVKENKTIQE